MESANLKFFYGISSSCLRLFRLRGILFSFKQNMFRGGVVMPGERERLILGLRAKGWTDTEIADFLLWIESGDEQYKPKAESEK